MVFLPVIVRELRVRARIGRTYWMRFAIGSCGALVCVMQLIVGDASGGPGAAGGYAFQGLVVAAFVVCCGACIATSDTISWERREGTLGLLFLTRVRGPDVVLGKLASAVLVNVCAVLAFLPVLMIPVLSGGVTGGEAFRKGLVLLDTLFLSLAVGLWTSSRGREAFKTARAALIVMLIVLVVPLILDRATFLYQPLPNNTINLISPFRAMAVADDAEYRISRGPYWISLLFIQMLAWFFVARAAARVRNSLQEPEQIGNEANVSTIAASADSLPTPRARFSHGFEPIGWLVHQQRGVRAMIWTAVGVGLAFFVLRIVLPLIIGFASTLPGTWATMLPLSLTHAVIMSSLLAWASSRFFLEARRSGELELLVTTPGGARSIVSEQWRALLRVLRWPLVLMVIPLLLQMVMMWMRREMSQGGSWQLPYTISMLFAIVNTVLGVFCLCWLGMWYGLKSATQVGAIVRTVAWAKAVPYGLSYGCLLIFNLAVGFNRFAYPAYFVFFMPQVVTLVFYIWLLRRVKRRFLGELRDAEPVSLSSVKGLWNDGARFIRAARHWTPP